MRFIRLTGIGGGFVWLNAAMITEMYRRQDNTVVYLINTDMTITGNKHYVKETPQEIIKLIREAE